MKFKTILKTGVSFILALITMCSSLLVIQAAPNDDSMKTVNGKHIILGDLSGDSFELVLDDDIEHEKTHDEKKQTINDQIAFDANGIVPIYPIGPIVSPTTWNPGPEPTSTVVKVSSNTTWAYPKSNATWLTISSVTPKNCSGNGSFTLSVTANTGNQRTGTVLVMFKSSAGSITITINVTQAAGYTLTVSPTTWNTASAPAYTTIYVISNTRWNRPTSSVSWLTITNITPTNCTGNGSFRLNVTANTGSKRTGLVTITNSTGTITRTISVTQEKK